jgi:hypothetical protein
VLQQEFWGEQWPLPCSYFYVQRFEFLQRWTLPRGGWKHRTRLRDERDVPTRASPRSRRGKLFRLLRRLGLGKLVHRRLAVDSPIPNRQTRATNIASKIPRAQAFTSNPIADNSATSGHGDNAFIYVTLDHPDRDEGDSDMITIGPCCNRELRTGTRTIH